MYETLQYRKSAALLLRSRKNRAPAADLRPEVNDMLRDVAFVLAQTRRVREEMVAEGVLAAPESQIE